MKRPLALLLASALVVLSPGMEASRIFAQVVGRAAPAAGVRPVAGMSAAPVLSAPALTAPAALMGAPSLSVSVAPSAASMPQMAAALAPQLEAIAQPATSASGAAAAGRGIEDVITGARSAGTGGLSAVAGAVAAPAPALLAFAAVSAAADGPKTGVPAAAAPAEGKTVSSEASYRVHRLLLSMIASLTGAVNSLPTAGPELTRTLIARAADKRVVLSDYDDTLAHYNVVLPQDMVEAVQAIRAAGKDFAVISDRGDEKRANSLTVFDSLASLPVETRAGMYVAANSGGRVYRYDEKGEPVRVFELPALTDAQKAKVLEASAATKAHLAELGTEAFVPAPGSAIPAESWNTYGYALMLKVGSSKEAVVKAAEKLQDELNTRGFAVEVSPRFAKDAANPPYINFSIVTKAPAAEYIAKALKAEAKDLLVIGDSQYAPHHPKKTSWLTRLGLKLSGRSEIPATGNQTDRNMEKGVPGALTLSVGTTGDPRASTLWVLGGKGPAVTREVLMSVASKKRGGPAPMNLEDVANLAAAVGLITATIAAYYLLATNLADWIAEGERLLHQGAREFQDMGMIFGGTVAGLYGMAGREPLGNPGDSYGRAWKKAVEIAAARGVPAEQVKFVEATASMPETKGPNWHYTFEIPGKNGGIALVYADFDRVSVYEGAPVRTGRLAAPLAPHLIAMGTKGLDPEGALSAARKAQPGMSAGVGVSFTYREEKVSGDRDLWYTFYDNRGATVSVNARTSEVRVDTALPAKAEHGDGFFRDMFLGLGMLAVYLGVFVAGFHYIAAHAPAAVSSVPVAPGGWEMLFGGTLAALAAKNWTLKQSVSPVSPVDGFETFVYDEALGAVSGLAVQNGYKPEKLRLTAAKLSPRAWGEDWTFSFSSVSEGIDKPPRSYEVKVRRTMVSETLVDAYDLKDLGRIGLPESFPASAVRDAIKVTPMDAVARSGDDARALELKARWPDNGGPAELVWVIRGEKGRELKSVNATTGEERVPQPWAKAKRAALTIALIAAAAAIYGGLAWAFSHAPAAVNTLQIPEGWQGPIPDNIDIGRMFGAAGILGAATGILRRVKGAKAPKPAVTDERVASAARGVISYKGRPWSMTEYNMSYYTTLDTLKREGATEGQLAKFAELCAAAPIKGGSFNPWSGD
jgi:hydroxymethylpyrimidine pyrophosphatase-like HAD family hydrolase